MKDKHPFDYFFDKEQLSPYLEIPVETETEEILIDQEWEDVFNNPKAESYNEELLEVTDEFEDEMEDELDFEEDEFEDEMEDEFEFEDEEFEDETEEDWIEEEADEDEMYEELLEKNEFTEEETDSEDWEAPELREEEEFSELDLDLEMHDEEFVPNEERFIAPKEQFLLQQQVSISPPCNPVSKSTLTPAIGFEFDLNIGSTEKHVPPPGADYSRETKKITKHKKSVDGFRLKGDGNRIEIATVPFEFTDAGKREMNLVMGRVIDLIADIQKRCKATKPDYSLRYSKKIGAPKYFEPPRKKSKVSWIFPLSFYPKKRPYYSKSCRIGASPQATLTLPLAKINEFVTIIKKSERYGWSPGKTLSGPTKSRQGNRSIALYDAQRMVNISRNWHIKHKTALPSGKVVSASNFSPTLQGLMILMVSYLRTSELKYHPKNDYEIFAKAYLPLNVKNPMRLLFADLTADEKEVFSELYNNPKKGVKRMLYRLAYKRTRYAKDSDKDKQLFPARVKNHQERYFHRAPTWGDFLEKTVKNEPLLREVDDPTGKEKGEHVGCEVLWAPLSKNIPYETDSRRVTVEMRRLGFDWVRSNRWLYMTKRLYNIARKLNL